MNVNKDLNYAFALTGQCLRILGVWPDPLVPLSKFQRPNIRFIVVTCILSLYIFVPQVTNMILAWGNVSRMVEYLSSANYCLIALCKLIATWYHGKALQTVMASVITDWTTSKNQGRTIMLNMARRGRILSFRCYASMSCTVAIFIFFNILKFIRNISQTQRSLVYRFVLLYHSQKSPNYEITFFIQLSGGAYAGVINSTVDSYISILLLHISAQMINLRTSLNNLVEQLAEGSISSSIFKKGLAAITTRHEHLIRNARTINDCYSAVLFVHMLSATFQLCFESFQVFTIITSNMDVPIIKVTFLSFYFVAVVMHLYTYCYSAERLSTESTNMAYGVYECKWYDISSKDAKNLMFMVHRSTIPLRLTAGKFGTFSLEMFGTTIKTSMGYLSALLTLTDYLNYAFALSRQCLRMLGVWPDPLVPLSEFQRPNIRFIVVTCILSLYVFVPQVTNMILAWGNVSRMVEYLSSANFSLMALCKLIGTWYHGEALRTLMASVITDWTNSKNQERNIMLNIARRGRILSFRCYVSMTCTVLFYISLNVLKFIRNVSQTQRSLVYRFNYPYNTQKSPNYEITFFTQLSGGAYSAIINCTVDSYISILLLHICAQLINLRISLYNLVEELAAGSISSLIFKKELAAITIRHEHLIKNAKTINDCYSAVLFVHMLAATFQLCFESFQVFTIITSNMSVSIIKLAFLSFYFVLVLTHLYIYCYSAEQLLTESTNMAYGVYECKWYNISSKDAKNLMFMVHRSTIPLRLTAGKFGIFSLEMFGTTVKTSMGYLSALLTLMD
ncbi:uncharacterized protein LOC105839480 [Monomorium pharaonis]|uniref:uncharacterized protein LOC105839480 n=1 Tax=Monomorium pharaonis TaxID=307658 RepID=UPI00174668F7|nr:uncharacterized protein LOC105839480 [Monomorium pharaonis]